MPRSELVCSFVQRTTVRSCRGFDTPGNAAATALMAKMKIAPTDRAKVKLECLRLVATLKLDPARSTLIGGFLDTYLRLSAAEMGQYRRAFEKLAPGEKETTMTLVSSWEQKGLSQGRTQGLRDGHAETILRLTRKRFGAVSENMRAQVSALSTEQLGELTETFLDFSTVADLEHWLVQRS